MYEGEIKAGDIFLLKLKSISLSTRYYSESYHYFMILGIDEVRTSLRLDNEKLYKIFWIGDKCSEEYLYETQLRNDCKKVSENV